MRLNPRQVRMAVIPLLFLLPVLASCGSTSTTAAIVNGKNCMKVGVLLPETATSARWEADDHPDLVAALNKDLPGVHIDYNNAQGSAPTQQTQAEADLTKGDCILILAPVDANQAAKIVDDAKADNVPVISYDRLIQDKNLAYYVSFDGVEVGKLQGTYIADNYSKFVSAGHNNMVMIDGAETDNNALLFKTGAHDILDPLVAAGTLKLVDETFTPNWDNPTAETEMEGYLSKNHNDIQIAYVANDGMAGTVIQALKAQGLAGKVLVTGQDATVAGIQQILLGNQSMTVYKPIPLEAGAAAQIAADLSKGVSTDSMTNGVTTATTDGGAIPSVLETPKAVDLTNIASTVLADGYVTKAGICAPPVPAGADGIC